MYIDLATINMAPGQGAGKPEMSFSVTPSTSNVAVTPDEGYVFSGGVVEAVTSAIDANIRPENITEGVSILGVSGTAVVPSGGLSITSNGVYNVNHYAEVNVSVSGQGPVTGDGLTINSPLTVAQAIEMTVSGQFDPNQKYFVKGIIKSATRQYTASAHTARFYIVDVGGLDTFYAYNLMYYGNRKYDPSVDCSITLEANKSVVIYGQLVYYNQTTPEMSPGQLFVYDGYTGLAQSDSVEGLATPSKVRQTVIPTNCGETFSKVVVEGVTAAVDENIVAGNIKSGVSILGVTGSYTGADTETLAETITLNGTYNFSPSPGYVFDSAVVTVSVSGGAGIDYRYEKGTIDGLDDIGYDPESIGIANANILHYANFDGYYDVSQYNKDLYGVIDEYNIIGYPNAVDMKYVPYFNVTETDWATYFKDFAYIRYIPKFDTSRVYRFGNSANNASGCFRGCKSLVTIPKLDTSNATDMYGMFMSCENLESVPELNTSNVIDMTAMFRYCSSLKNAPMLDTSKCEIFWNMFYGCTTLKYIPQYDVSSGTTFTGMFQGCKYLEEIPALDTSNGTDFTNFLGFYQLVSTQSASATSVTFRPDNLRAVNGIDFSSLTAAPNLFGTSTSTYVLPTGYEILTHFIVNGVIDFDWTGNYGLYRMPNLDFDSIKSILQAMGRANTGHSILFRTTITDDALGTLQSLYDDCVNRLGWTITGLTINNPA